MPNDDISSDAIQVGTNRTELDALAVPAIPHRQPRTAMLATSLLLGLGALTSLIFFGYQLYKFLITGGAYAPTTVPWPVILGHFVRAVGLFLICTLVAKSALNINAQTGELSSEFAIWHRRLWRTVPCVLLILAAFTVFEYFYTAKRDLYGFFRPEFESGYVLLDPKRIHFRRGSEAPVNGWVKEKVRQTQEVLFVSPEPEIKGSDIHQAMLRIAEIFPGDQVAQVHIEFTLEGGKKMEKLTKSHFAKPLAVFLDGELRARPRIFSQISSRAQLTRVFTLEEAAEMIRENPER